MRPAAERLGLKITNESLQSGVGEKKVASGETHIRELQLGDAHFFDLDIGVLPGDDSGEVFGTQHLDGIIGLEIFRDLVVRHDYIQKQLTFSLPDKFVYKGSFHQMEDTIYNAIPEYLDEKQLEPSGTFIEEYQSDPVTTPEDKFDIQIFVLLK